MPSFTTISRAIVMLVVGAIVFKIWTLYGPSTAQVTSAVVSAVELAESTWKGQQPTGDSVQSNGDSGRTAPPFAKMTQPPAIDPAPSPATATLTQPNTTSIPISVAPGASTPASPPAAPPLAEPAVTATSTSEDRVPALLSRLEKLGAAEPQLTPWGSSGHLYRFCCRAPLADSASYTRHFESVAAEPAIAVEQVVAKVEAWRTTQRGDTVLR